MPPQGESVGFCLEDAIVFARCLAAAGRDNEQVAFSNFERLRRQRIEEAHAEASFRFSRVKDAGWFATKIVELVTPLILWWGTAARERGFQQDLATEDLQL